MARQALEILVKTIDQSSGQLKTVRANLDNLDKGLGSLNNALGAFGLAIGGAEVVAWANETRQAAIELQNAENALTSIVGSTAGYNEAIKAIQQTTRGTISETEAARVAFGLLDNGIAQSADQAAQFALAGKAFESAFGQTASYEKFLMLLDEGSQMLLNNFNISGSLVDARKREIEATTDLTGREAELQAIRQIALEKGLDLAKTVSDEAIAAQQAAAAYDDFQAAFGKLIVSLDRATGITTGLTSLFQDLTAGADAWAGMGERFNGITEALGNVKLGLNATTEEMNNLASAGGDWFAAPIDAVGAFTGALWEGKGAVQAYQDGWQEVLSPLGDAASAVIQLATDEQELGAAIQQATGAIPPQTSSLEAMGFSAAGAAGEVRELTDAQRALADQAASQAGAFGGQQDSFTQGRALAGIRQAGAARLEAQARAKEAEEQAAEEQQKTARQTAQTMAKSFDDAASQISSSISGAVGEAVGALSEVWNPGGGEADAANGPAQWARRMAAIAAGGIKDEWADPTRWADFGGDQSILQPLFNAISSGDDAAVKAQAQALLANKTADLFDANMIAAQVEQKLRAQQLQQQLNDRVNALLGERGLEGIQNVTQQVQNVVTDTGLATGLVNQEMTNVGTSAETSAAKIGEAFTTALTPVDILNERFRLMAGLIERVNVLANQAGGAISAMNPPAANLPNAADKAMGGYVQQ